MTELMNESNDIPVNDTVMSDNTVATCNGATTTNTAPSINHNILSAILIDNNTTNNTVPATTIDKPSILISTDRIPSWFPYLTNTSIDELTSTQFRRVAIIWNQLIYPLVQLRLSESSLKLSVLGQNMRNVFKQINTLIGDTDDIKKLHPLLFNQPIFTAQQIDDAIQYAIKKQSGASQNKSVSSGKTVGNSAATATAPVSATNPLYSADALYPVPIYYDTIGGLNILSLDVSQLMKYVRQWNILLNIDADQINIQKWKLPLRVIKGTADIAKQYILDRIIPIYIKWKLWQNNSQLNMLLPISLQNGFQPPIDIKSVTNTTNDIHSHINVPAPTQYQSNKFRIPSFITAYSGFDLADLTYSDLIYCIQQWNTHVQQLTQFAKIKSIDISNIDDTVDNRLKLQEQFGERLYYFIELQNDPNLVSKLPQYMQPLIIHSDEKRQRQQPAKLIETISVDDNTNNINSKTKSIVAKQSASPPKQNNNSLNDNNNKSKSSKPNNTGLNGKKSSADEIIPNYVLVQTKPLYPAHLAHTQKQYLSYDKNHNKMMLGYRLLDVYRLIKVIYSYITQYPTGSIDWTHISELYLSTYYKLIPESECKLVWKYVAYNMNNDGTVKLDAESMNRFLASDSDNEDIQQSSNKVIRQLSMPAVWDSMKHEHLLQAIWQEHEQFRKQVFDEWSKTAPLAAEYSGMFAQPDGKQQVERILSDSVHKLDPATIEQVNWNKVAATFHMLTNNDIDSKQCIDQYQYLLSLYYNNEIQLHNNLKYRMTALLNKQAAIEYRNRIMNSQYVAQQQPPVLHSVHRPSPQLQHTPTQAQYAISPQLQHDAQPQPQHSNNTSPSQLYLSPQESPQQCGEQPVNAIESSILSTPKPRMPTIKLQNQLQQNRSANKTIHQQQPILARDISPSPQHHPQLYQNNNINNQAQRAYMTSNNSSAQSPHPYSINDQLPQLNKISRYTALDTAADSLYQLQHRKQQSIDNIVQYVQLLQYSESIDVTNLNSMTIDNIQKIEYRLAEQYQINLTQKNIMQPPPYQQPQLQQQTNEHYQQQQPIQAYYQ